MAEQIILQVDVNTDANATKTIKQLTDEFKLLKKEVAETEIGTQEYYDSLTRLTSVQGDLSVMKDDIRAMGSSALSIETLSGAVTGLTSAFTAVQGVIALTGVESEELQAALLKVNGAMALAQGIKGIADARQQMKGLLDFVLRLAPAMSAVGTSTNAASAGMSKLSKLLITSGIGALIAALGLVVAYWDDIKISINGAGSESDDYYDTIIGKQSKVEKAIRASRDTYKKLTNEIGDTKDAADGLWGIIIAIGGAATVAGSMISSAFSSLKSSIVAEEKVINATIEALEGKLAKIPDVLKKATGEVSDKAKDAAKSMMGKIGTTISQKNVDTLLAAKLEAEGLKKGIDSATEASEALGNTTSAVFKRMGASIKAFYVSNPILIWVLAVSAAILALGTIYSNFAKRSKKEIGDVDGAHEDLNKTLEQEIALQAKAKRDSADAGIAKVKASVEIQKNLELELGLLTAINDETRVGELLKRKIARQLISDRVDTLETAEKALQQLAEEEKALKSLQFIQNQSFGETSKLPNLWDILVGDSAQKAKALEAGLEAIKVKKETLEEVIAAEKGARDELKLFDAKATSDEKKRNKSIIDEQKELQRQIDIVNVNAFTKSLSDLQANYEKQKAAMEADGKDTTLLTELYLEQKNKLHRDYAAEYIVERDARNAAADADEAARKAKELEDAEAQELALYEIRLKGINQREEAKNLGAMKGALAGDGSNVFGEINTAELDQIAQENLIEALDFELELRKSYGEDTLEVETALAQARIDLTNSVAQNEAQAMLDRKEILTSWFEFGLELAGNTFKASKAGFIANKAISMASASVDTFVGANKALASSPPPFNFISAGAVITAGLANVAKIFNTSWQNPNRGASSTTTTTSNRTPSLPSVPNLVSRPTRVQTTSLDGVNNNTISRVVMVETDTTRVQGRVRNIESAARF